MKKDYVAIIRKRLRTIPGMFESPGTYYVGEDAFWVNGKEVAHFHGPDAMELRLTKPVIRERRDALRADPRVELRAGASDWLIVRFSSLRDVSLVVELAELAAAAHRPPEGVPLRPPPVGADLARRRRFH